MQSKLKGFCYEAVTVTIGPVPRTGPQRLRLERRQTGGKTDKHKAYQTVADFRQLLFRLHVTRDERAGEDQKAHIDEADYLQGQRQNKERQPGIVQDQST